MNYFFKLNELYNNRYLYNKICYNNISNIPKLDKISIDIKSNLLIQNKKYILPIYLTLEILTGLKPLNIKAKKSLAELKIKKDMILGSKISIFNKYLVEFLLKTKNFIFSKKEENFKYIKKGKPINTNGHLNLFFPNFKFYPELNQAFETFQ